ncbi:phospholipase [Brevibacillus borstelensis]|nr:phospholipase A2 family protein [Brevibacillus borstelensis]MCC0564071.1 phospholipase [Brevibacillus borstelensis]MCM3470811.1 phospholipase [Brevibacillus borstelensis]MCM3558847.1 phospholipase [Brevibacillus borstelensis]MCM3592226.1 phospholipase [Brevibacillus borstelensis]MCM3622915.1 phospholipase [Brevibacillus borstelensis]
MGMYRDRKSRKFPCFYGNWCGPGCSGPEPPIDDVDACCRKHDLCYKKRGYFACSCDQKMLKCLKHKRNADTAAGRKAMMMYLYYQNSFCDPNR